MKEIVLFLVKMVSSLRSKVNETFILVVDLMCVKCCQDPSVQYCCWTESKIFIEPWPNNS